jgi:hypothetical protein
MIIAGVALAALLALYLRSRSASSSSASTTAQQAAAQAAAQQAQVDQAAQYTASGGGGSIAPSTFADNGAQAAALGDAVTQGLSGVQTALNSLQQPAAAATDTTLPGPDNSPAPTQITINNTPAGQPAGSPASAPAKAKLPPPPASGGHYVSVAGKPVLIHATGKNTWAPGPPPKPPLKAKTPNGNKKR